MKAISNFLDLSDIAFFQTPYSHFQTSSAFSDNIARKICNWLSDDAPWSLVETDFYEQYECSLLNVMLPYELRFLSRPTSLRFVKQKMEKIFNVTLAETVGMTAHKLTNGQSIRLHNDYIGREETHRLVIHLNAEWKDKNGGLFIICSSPEPEDIYGIIRPLYNSAVGFAISEQSHHAVSKVHGPDRYSLVYSFRKTLTGDECNCVN